MTPSYFLRSCPSEAELFFGRLGPVVPTLLLMSNPASIPDTELNLRDRVLGEAEKNSYVALSGKEGAQG